MGAELLEKMTVKLTATTTVMTMMMMMMMMTPPGAVGAEARTPPRVSDSPTAPPRGGTGLGTPRG